MPALRDLPNALAARIRALSGIKDKVQFPKKVLHNLFVAA